jgi:hypothetical protein
MLVGVNIGGAQAATQSVELSPAVVASVEVSRTAQVSTPFTNPANKLTYDAERLASGEPPTDVGTLGWKQKAFAYALRHGGSLLSKFLKRLSPRAAGWVEKNAGKLADFIDTPENVAEYPIVISHPQRSSDRCGTGNRKRDHVLHRVRCMG